MLLCLNAEGIFDKNTSGEVIVYDTDDLTCEYVMLSDIWKYIRNGGIIQNAYIARSKLRISYFRLVNRNYVLYNPLVGIFDKHERYLATFVSVDNMRYDIDFSRSGIKINGRKFMTNKGGIDWIYVFMLSDGVYYISPEYVYSNPTIKPIMLKNGVPYSLAKYRSEVLLR